MADPGVPRTSPRPTRRVVLLAAGAVAVVGLALLARWWTRPSIFTDHGDSMVMEARPTGTTLHVAVTFPLAPGRDPDDEPYRLTFAGASAELGRDSADAEVSFSVCAGGDRDPVGAVFGRLDRYCDEVEPLTEGTTMTYPSPTAQEYVVVSIRSTRPGATRLTGVDLEYSLGSQGWWRRGVDEVDMDVLVRAR